MPPFIDYTGMRFGKLTVIERAPKKGNTTKWKCVCDCGNTTVVVGTSLKGGITRSCSCIHKEQLASRNRKHGNANRSGVSPTFSSWNSMLKRCRTKKNYSDRGITVCDRWSGSFEAFLSDMGERPTLDHSIDRIDVNGNYEPSNCRWAGRHEQSTNRRILRNNKSGVTGVYYCNTSKKWKAQITHFDRQILLGAFDYKEDAIQVRKEAETKYHRKPSL